MKEVQLKEEEETKKTKMERKQELWEDESTDPKTGKCEKCGEFFESR